MVLTDAFTKFSKVFVTPNQEALSVAKNIGGQMVLGMWHFHTNS